MGLLTFPLRLLGQAVSMNAADLSTATKPWEVQLDLISVLSLQNIKEEAFLNSRYPKPLKLIFRCSTGLPR